MADGKAVLYRMIPPDAVCPCGKSMPQMFVGDERTGGSDGLETCPGWA